MSWRFPRTLVLSAAVRIIALLRATVSALSVAEQELMSEWLCWEGMRVTAKDAAGRVCAMLVTGQGCALR